MRFRYGQTIRNEFAVVENNENDERVFAVKLDQRFLDNTEMVLN